MIALLTVLMKDLGIDFLVEIIGSHHIHFFREILVDLHNYGHVLEVGMDGFADVASVSIDFSQ